MSLFATLSRSVALAVMLVITSPAALAQLAPTDEQRQAAVEIAEALRYGHYADIDFDEQWSQEAFQRYLDILDGQRSYLLNRDIEPSRSIQVITRPPFGRQTCPLRGQGTTWPTRCSTAT